MNELNKISIEIQIAGLICAEGESWREHRRFVMNVMKQLGMAGRQGASVMESRVMAGVLEFVHVLPKQFHFLKIKFKIYASILRNCPGTGVSGVDGRRWRRWRRFGAGIASLHRQHHQRRRFRADVRGRRSDLDLAPAPAGPRRQTGGRRRAHQFPARSQVSPPTANSPHLLFFTFFLAVQLTFLFCSGGRAKVLAQLSEDHVVHPWRPSRDSPPLPGDNRPAQSLHQSRSSFGFWSVRPCPVTVSYLIFILDDLKITLASSRPTYWKWNVVNQPESRPKPSQLSSCTTCWPTCLVPGRTRHWRPSSGSSSTWSSTRTCKSVHIKTHTHTQMVVGWMTDTLAGCWPKKMKKTKIRVSG